MLGSYGRLKNAHPPPTNDVKYLNVTILGDRVFTDTFKLKILRWEDNLGLSWWAINAITYPNRIDTGRKRD